MSVIGLNDHLDLVQVAPSRLLLRVHVGAPILTVRRARSWRRFGAVVAVLVGLGGWLASIHAWHHFYDPVYGWSALGTYLAFSACAQLLSIVPQLRFRTED